MAGIDAMPLSFVLFTIQARMGGPPGHDQSDQEGGENSGNSTLFAFSA